MTCHRCGGLMVTEHYDDFHDHTGRAVLIGWRCVTCGAILDPAIAMNQRTATRKRSPHQPVIP
jgi:uncharacterized OB-fold protein